MLDIELWQKIANFEINKHKVSLTFTQRLARENNFSEAFAQEIVVEYKKYIYLYCISPQMLTPSSYVDLAWHLHLTYTQSYWIDFCQNTLQKSIHHTPTEGGKAEHDLELYETTFNQKPPEDIWENITDRFSNDFVTINKSEYWIIRKIKLQKIFYKNYLFVSFILFSFFLLFSVDFYGGIVVVLIIFTTYLFAQILGYSPRYCKDGDSGADCGCGSGCGGCGG